MKSNSIMECAIIGNEIVWTFKDGPKLHFDVAKASDDLCKEAVYHGFKQKIADAAAISRNPETGKSATIVEKRAAMASVIQRLYTGAWNEPRESGGDGGLLLRALMALKPDAEPAKVRAFHDGLTKEQRAIMRTEPRVAAEIDKIRAKKAADAGFDAAASLEELE